MAGLLCLLLVACGGDDEAPATLTASPATPPTRTPVAEASPTPTATTPPTPEPTRTPVPRPAANPFPPQLQTEALALQHELAELRGVEDPEPVDMLLLTREQAREFYATDDDESPGATPTPGPPPLDPRQELYELLGLVPEAQPGTDTPTVKDEEIDNLISIITGFYDSRYNAFYMIETINGGIFGLLARSTIVHELTHALQYQAIDLNGASGERGGNFDATTALLSLIEGDAVNSEIELLGFSTRSTLRQPVCFEIPPSRYNGTPYAIERELDVWYEDGLCFIQAIAAQGGPDGIERLFSDLPTTMEQILHPEKYLAGEAAQPIAPKPLDQALGGDWRGLSNGRFGEFGLQNILLNGLPEDRELVQEAAAGWGGDAWSFYVAGDARLLHIETVWDTDADAPQFLDALVLSLENLGFGATTEGSTTTATAGAVTWSLALRDHSVTVLVSNDGDALRLAEEALTLR